MERLPVELTVVRSQPGPVSDGQWSTGLCECYGDMSDCCFALWCLPVFACKTSRAAGGCVCLPLLDCVSCVPPASLAMRAAVRERYGIEWKNPSTELDKALTSLMHLLFGKHELRKYKENELISEPHELDVFVLATCACFLNIYLFFLRSTCLLS
ncbi:uncharacterized protein LOC131355665 isoform X1 [Hemibagrus wyckioides]|uniref:uncharacterized protein LOC131355665 isoform X1 n=1 Tax=Hemibagrus wyckioides TaxID=337641 RepID=UPI00266BD6DC|nr:uncharacterized protein LOC131355665 isoform X1 [Hemibagrus wyckioides]